MLSDVFLTSISARLTAGHSDEPDILLATYADTGGFQLQMDYHILAAQRLTSSRHSRVDSDLAEQSDAAIRLTYNHRLSLSCGVKLQNCQKLILLALHAVLRNLLDKDGGRRSSVEESTQHFGSHYQCCFIW